MVNVLCERRVQNKNARTQAEYGIKIKENMQTPQF